MTVNEQWKQLRPQIGSFISSLDGLYKGAENLDEALAKAEERGYKKGFQDDKQTICKHCNANEFYRKCNGYLATVETFASLSDKSKETVKKMIYQLSLLESRGTEIDDIF